MFFIVSLSFQDQDRDSHKSVSVLRPRLRLGLLMVETVTETETSIWNVFETTRDRRLYIETEILADLWNPMIFFIGFQILQNVIKKIVANQNMS